MDLKLGDSRLIISACAKEGLLRNQAAYVLATAYHETAHTVKPITEMGGQKYLRSKKYWPFIGRGYVQLTWKTNYADWSKRLGVDLVAKPQAALETANACRILVQGMKLGTFTKKKLDDYITLTKSDFVGARRIINGTDKASLIAGYAKDYDALLKADGYGDAPAKIAAVPDPVPVVPDPPSKDTVRGVQERLKALGYNPGTPDPIKGWDGLLGPLTTGSILSFKNDNALTPSDAIDEALLTALATATPRKMPDSRANATVTQVAAKVPEANVHWWNRIGAAIVGGGTAATGAADYIAPATGYLQPVKDFVGDVPGYVWIGGVVLLCLALYVASQYGAKKAQAAFQAGDRR